MFTGFLIPYLVQVPEELPKQNERVASRTSTPNREGNMYSSSVCVDGSFFQRSQYQSPPAATVFLIIIHVLCLAIKYQHRGTLCSWNMQHILTEI